MAIIAGIDEAGLGPTLGPLVVSAVAFRVADDRADACLWELLADVCTSDVRRTGHRLVIADSKKMFAGRKSLALLERAALIMHAIREDRSPGSARARPTAARAHDAIEHPTASAPVETVTSAPVVAHTSAAVATRSPVPPARDMTSAATSNGPEHSESSTAATAERPLSCRVPGTWRSLLHDLARPVLPEMEQYPWYVDADWELPLSKGVGDLGTRANAVRRACVAQGVTFLGAQCEPVLAGRYNHLIERTRNKAVVLSCTAMGLAARVVRSAGAEPVRLYIDRLGGRMHYREVLTTAGFGEDLHIVEETETSSVYRFTKQNRRHEIRFVTGADARHMPVSLASIYSKYLRETFMKAFNEFFTALQPGLKPTAGYYTDAKRWLADAEEMLARQCVDRTMLIRVR